MKKIHTFLLTLLLVSVIVNISSSTAVFYDFTELNYTYEVVNSEWDIQLGVLSTTSSGLYFGENNYPVGSKYDLQILAHTPLTVDYNTTMGTDTEENTDTCHTSPLVDLVRLPGYLMLLNESWDQALFDDGPPKIFGTHFFALDNYSSIFSASVD
ncbi:MAG: hypothetical protein FK733_05945, partial [Asgard group archaeon]|nr:hypothetical protein [Asgard group archaeon]